VTRARVRPVDDERAVSVKQHVLGMKMRWMTEPPGPIAGSHTSAGMRNEIGATDAHDVRRRISVLAHVPHEGDLAGRHVALAVTTQDGTRIERVHIRVTTACERLDD